MKNPVEHNLFLRRKNNSGTFSKRFLWRKLRGVAIKDSPTENPWKPDVAFGIRLYWSEK